MTRGKDRTIAGKYRLLDLLGRGGMGSVWRATHLALDSSVAVKLVDPQIISQPDAMARFMREAQSAALLRSPHVVQILDYGVDGETPYIVMELLEGESLAARIERQRKLTPKVTADIITQVCRAVGRAHDRGIVHRDLKPDNIFLVADDDTEIAKVLDFGIAKHAVPGSHGMTQTGAILGTPYYMSPEQAEGARDVDLRSDLWALSVIAYECLVGTRPFEEETLGALVLAICARPLPIPSEVALVPSGFDQWFARGTARDRAKRFSSARELAATLRKVCGMDLSAHRSSDRVDTAEIDAPEANTAQASIGLFGGTNKPVSVTSAGDDEPIATPMHKLGLVWKLALVVLVLAGAVATFVFVRGTDSTAAPTPATSTTTGLIHSSLVTAEVANSTVRVVASAESPPVASGSLLVPPLSSVTRAAPATAGGTPPKSLNAPRATQGSATVTPTPRASSQAVDSRRRLTTKIDLGL